MWLELRNLQWWNSTPHWQLSDLGEVASGRAVGLWRRLLFGRVVPVELRLVRRCIFYNQTVLKLVFFKSGCLGVDKKKHPKAEFLCGTAAKDLVLSLPWLGSCCGVGLIPGLGPPCPPQKSFILWELITI